MVGNCCSVSESTSVVSQMNQTISGRNAGVRPGTCLGLVGGKDYIH